MKSHQHCDLRADKIAVLFACAISWSGPAATQEANPSLRCIYNLMTSARATMVFCGEPMDDASEAMFTDLRTALKKFINENARYEASKIAPDYDQKIQEHLLETSGRMGRAEFCGGDGFRFAKAVIQDIRTEAFAMKIRKRLEKPSDPMKGDCL